VSVGQIYLYDNSLLRRPLKLSDVKPNGRRALGHDTGAEPHAFGAAFDNPELFVACVIGDGEAETGPLATA
jgi:phosphoketolase